MKRNGPPFIRRTTLLILGKFGAIQRTSWRATVSDPSRRIRDAADQRPDRGLDWFTQRWPPGNEVGKIRVEWGWWGWWR